VVCGYAGSGKSTFARGLACRLGAVLIDIDAVTERLARLVLRGHELDPDDRDSPQFKALLREPIYETLFDVAEENLEHLPCVIVGPFTTERRQAGWPNLLEARLLTTVRIYYVHCPRDQRRQRLVQRRNPRDAAKLRRWELFAPEREDQETLPFVHEDIDTDEGLV
jgi:predicted kinase